MDHIKILNIKKIDTVGKFIVDIMLFFTDSDVMQMNFVVRIKAYSKDLRAVLPDKCVRDKTLRL